MEVCNRASEDFDFGCHLLTALVDPDDPDDNSDRKPDDDVRMAVSIVHGGDLVIHAAYRDMTKSDFWWPLK